MKPIAPIQADTSTRQTLLELLVQWLYQLSLPPWVISIALAAVLALGSGKLAVKLSRSYYAVAPYHYDSASYRMQAVQFYQIRQSQGTIQALVQALQAKDSLDVSLRLIFVPSFLLHPYGHMAVLVPFMYIFILLVIWYVFTRTKSLLLGLATTGYLFIFPMMYGAYGAPYIGGIADYWKDNLATWLLGSAAVAWLLAGGLARRQWSFLCGLLLGLLVMQRAVVAVYAAALFLPLVVWALYRHVRLDGVKQAIIQFSYFAAPAALLGGILVSVQWQQLYQYYFVSGYAYGSPVLVAQYLLKGASYVGFAPFVLMLCGVYCFCLISISRWREQSSDIIQAAWFACLLPLVVTASSAFYFGFYPLWMVLLVTLLAALIPPLANRTYIHLFASILLMVAAVAAAIQFNISTNQARFLAEIQVSRRQFFEQLIKIIGAQPEPRHYSLLFDEVTYPLLNQAYFDDGLLFAPPDGFLSIHDSYYPVVFGTLAPQQIAESNIHILEQNTGTLAVAYCDPNAVLKQPTFQDSNKELFAAHVALAMNDYLLHSPTWQAIRRLDSPYGCLYIYQHGTRVLSDQEKWQRLEFSKPITDLPLTLSVAPGVRVYDYTSTYRPELVNGIYYQWLPSGSRAKPGVQVRLFSDQARSVRLQGRASAGPARKDLVRTLVVLNRQQELSLRINDTQDFQIPLDLQAGLNDIQLYIQESADNLSPDSPDSRELMLLLISPQIVPDSN